MTEKKFIKVMDVMSNTVIKLERTATVHAAVTLMCEHHISSVFVERRDDDDEFGLIEIADVARDVLAKNLSPERVNVYEIMSKPVLTLAAEMNVVYAVRMLSRFQLARALVVDHDRNPLGVVTLRDMVLRCLEDDDV